MQSRFQKWIVPAALITASALICAALIAPRFARNGARFAGAWIHEAPCIENGAVPAVNIEEDVYDERFHRPSQETPYPNPYSFQDFVGPDDTPPLIENRPDNAEDTLLAYYGILREASNMLGFSGGCGTVGYAREPYPYAYELLTRETRKQMSLKQFEASFLGVGYTTLLKVIPMEETDKIACYFVELEIITGREVKPDGDYNQGSLFAYYYGTVQLEKNPREGWGINRFDYIPEDFLCAPWHGWSYFADAMVQIVYGDNMGLIESIVKTERQGDRVYIYAEGQGKEYRFDFVRLTNGYDILLQENVLKNGKWIETDLLTDPWAYLKLNCENFG